MDIYNDINYKNMPEDEECVINAVQIGKRIQEPPHTIRTWADLYENCLYIKKINGRFNYTEASVTQFQFIKMMTRDKGFSHAQTKEHIRNHGFEYNGFESGLIPPEGVEALEVSLGIKNQEQLKQFLGYFIQEQEKSNAKLIEDMKKEISITVQETVENELAKHYKSIEEELETTRHIIEQESELRKAMESRKAENVKKGIFSRLFKL